MIPAAALAAIIPHIPELAKLLAEELRATGYVSSVRDNADLQRAVAAASAKVSDKLRAGLALDGEGATHAP